MRHGTHHHVAVPGRCPDTGRRGHLVYRHDQPVAFALTRAKAKAEGRRLDALERETLAKPPAIDAPPDPWGRALGRVLTAACSDAPPPMAQTLEAVQALVLRRALARRVGLPGDHVPAVAEQLGVSRAAVERARSADVETWLNE